MEPVPSPTAVKQSDFQELLSPEQADRAGLEGVHLFEAHVSPNFGSCFDFAKSVAETSNSSRVPAYWFQFRHEGLRMGFLIYLWVSSELWPPEAELHEAVPNSGEWEPFGAPAGFLESFPCPFGFESRPRVDLVLSDGRLRMVQAGAESVELWFGFPGVFLRSLGGLYSKDLAMVGNVPTPVGFHFWKEIRGDGPWGQDHLALQVS